MGRNADKFNRADGHRRGIAATTSAQTKAAQAHGGNATPVSYTHLDVYKRQVIGIGRRGAAKQILAERLKHRVGGNVDGIRFVFFAGQVGVPGRQARSTGCPLYTYNCV